MHRYEIMKVIKSNETSSFIALEGMELIVIRFEGKNYSNNTISVPLKLEDYDKFFRWLFEEIKENWFCTSDTFEEFKIEAHECPDEMLPTINGCLSEFEYIRDYNKEDMEQHKIDYKKYFGI